MEPPAGLSVAADLAPALHLPGQLQIVLDVVLEVVGIDEVLASVVRRIDVDELDLAGVALLQDLQHFEVVALDHQVLRGVPVHAVFRARAQCAGRGRERELAGAALAVPVEAVLLVALVHRAAEQLLQYLEVHLPLGERLGEERLQLLDVARHDVGGVGLGVGSGQLLHRILGFHSLARAAACLASARLSSRFSSTCRET